MLKSKIIIGIADAKFSKDPDQSLITYSLGSCIGISLYDKNQKIGAMLHYQLPQSSMDQARAKQNPFMFADTGLEIILRKMDSMSINKKTLQVKVAGGASMDTGPKGFDIGKRNYLAIRKLLWKYSMFIDAEDVGGSIARNMELDIETGSVTIKKNGNILNL